MFEVHAFTLDVETKDKYGTITAGTPVTCRGYIEDESVLSLDGGSFLGKGRILTRSTETFAVDKRISFRDKTYTIKFVNYYSVPGFSYTELIYV